MAHVPLSSPDLFGMMCLQKGVSEHARREVLKVCAEYFGRWLKQVTPSLLAKAVWEVNRVTGSTLSLVKRGSLPVTIHIVEINGLDVTVELCFRDLKGYNEVPGRVMNEVWGKISRRTRFPSGLRFSGGALIGNVQLPPNVVRLPKQRLGSGQKVWPKSGRNDVTAEEAFIRQAGHLTR